jgi:predicted RNase H-like nuclease
VSDRDSLVAGIDGFKRGWLVAVWGGPGHGPQAIALPALIAAESLLPPKTTVIAVDIPLGLMKVAVPGGRPCDIEARAFLKGRASSVFSPPALPTLVATTYDQACRINITSGTHARKISRQSFELLPKLRDAEHAAATSVWLRDRIIEVHPEVSFGKLAGRPLMTRKRQADGKEERRDLLGREGFVNLESFERDAKALGAATDDALDACAAAWSAHRRHMGNAKCFPLDASGPDRAMRIWY